MEDLGTIALVSLLCGLAGFIDSIAGGGGLISLPAFLLTGLPTHVAAGTNKVAAFLGTSTAVATFARDGRIVWPEALSGMVGALLGSAVGAQLAVWLPEHLFRVLLVCVLPLVAGFLLVRGLPEPSGADLGVARGRAMWHRLSVSAAMGLGIGLYDGLVGPGTGTFLIIASVLLLRLPLVTSSANAKVINFASDMASASVFMWHGSCSYRHAIPAALCAMVGCYLGVRYCLRFGSRGIRAMLCVVLALLFASLVYDLLRTFAVL